MCMRLKRQLPFQKKKKKSTIRGGKKKQNINYKERKKRLYGTWKSPREGDNIEKKKKNTAEIDAFCMVKKKTNKQLSSFLSSFHIPHF